MNLVKKITIVVLCFVLCISLVACSSSGKDNTCYNDWDEFYSAIAKNCVDFSKSYTYKTTLKMGDFSYYKLRDAITEIDGVVAGFMYGVTWKVKNCGSYQEVEMYFKYTVSKSQYKKVCTIAKDIAKSMRGWTDYEKIKATHDFLIDINDYNIRSDGAYRALYKGQTNCNGYALAFMAIMRECGIPCTYETGDNHAWNSVMLEGHWYNIDVTWDDTGVWDKEGGILYNNFLKSNADWASHEHGNATATTSYNGDLTLHKDIPNYATIYMIRDIILIIVGLVAVFFINRFIQKKKREKQKLRPSTALHPENSLVVPNYNSVQPQNTITNDDIICGQ